MPPYHPDRHSPLSSSEPISGSTSPHIIKPPVFFPKQRLSSMTSATSSHSAQNRSMSIVSLESPRNSIISLEGEVKRTHSTTSLQSLGRSDDENYVVHSKKLTKRSDRVSSAILSDDDSDSPRPFARDFSFKFCPGKPEKDPIPPLDKPFNSPTPSHSPPKDHKKKSTTSPRLALLKKKLIFSKDIQLELISSPATSNLDKQLDTKFVDIKRSSPTSPLLPSSKHSLLFTDMAEYANQPVLSTLKQQNDFISQLNRRWNKSTLKPGSESPKSPAEDKSRSRKRSRRELFGDD